MKKFLGVLAFSFAIILSNGISGVSAATTDNIKANADVWGW